MEPYEAKHIRVMNSRDAVRKRPGMYIGDTDDGSGLLHMVWEVLANAIDQFLAHRCTKIELVLSADGRITVTDDGAGISVRQIESKAYLEKVCTEMHTGPTADGHAPHEHLVRHGVGIMVVNSLSSLFSVRTHNEGSLYSVDYGRGLPLAPLRSHGPSDGRGTSVCFTPDSQIFSDTWLDAGKLGRRLQELACLFPPLELTLIDQRVQRFHEPRGIEGLLERMIGRSTAIRGRLLINGAEQEIQISAAAAWLPDHLTRVESFANSERITEHGTHVDGFMDALLAATRSALPAACHELTNDEVRNRVERGLRAVVCVLLIDPQYGHPTRDRLCSTRAVEAVRAVTEPAMRALLASDALLRERFLTALTDR